MLAHTTWFSETMWKIRVIMLDLRLRNLQWSMIDSTFSKVDEVQRLGKALTTFSFRA